jgi:putative Ca2+/H+ antiporter (TMEM165/GDT1 family)
MADLALASLGAIAGAIFVAELTDKDAFLLIGVSMKMKAWVAFLAGITAFTITTTLFVTLGSILVTVVPVYLIRDAGGVVMLAYGLWQARGLVGLRAVEEQESLVARSGSPLRAFLALVAALAFLDIAGDATEVLTIVFVAHYSNLVFVFAGVCAGLYLATAVETAMGSRLGRLLTPGRLQYVSVGVFVTLGLLILFFNFV